MLMAPGKRQLCFGETQPDSRRFAKLLAGKVSQQWVLAIPFRSFRREQRAGRQRIQPFAHLLNRFVQHSSQRLSSKSAPGEERQMGKEPLLPGVQCFPTDQK